MSTSYNLKLPTVSFCGVDFGNTKWVRHLGKCSVCKAEVENMKLHALSAWDKLCECGCGKISPYGKRLCNGHHTKETNHVIGQKASERMKRCNPMHDSAITRQKVSEALTGRKYPEQSGENNVAKRLDVRKKISLNNPMRQQKHRDTQRLACLTDKEVLRRSVMMKSNNPSRDVETLAKRIDTYTKRLANGEYHLRNRWKTGWYTKKNGEQEWYSSSFELAQMKDYDEEGVFWTKKHGIRIAYVNEKGRNTYYVPDFLVIRGDGTSIEEIKGWLRSSVETKAQAAIKYCKDKGFSYILLLGEKRELVEQLSWKEKSE